MDLLPLLFLTSASWGLFFFHHLTIAMLTSPFGLRRGLVRARAPIMVILNNNGLFGFLRLKVIVATKKIFCVTSQLSHSQTSGHKDKSSSWGLSVLGGWGLVAEAGTL
jgi:hypothetical protein